jgi:Flp pilus assembly protein TadG
MVASASLRRFAQARQGMAAVEFALIAPMMILLMFGSVELIDALGANRRVQNTAASLADVVARDTEVSDAEVTGLWAAADVLMFPDPTGDLGVRVTSISVESATVARVVWSEGHNGLAPLGAGDTVDLPAAIMTPGSSLIRADTTFVYQAPLDFLFTDDVNMTHTSYRRSRVVDPIPREGA